MGKSQRDGRSRRRPGRSGRPPLRSKKYRDSASSLASRRLSFFESSIRVVLSVSWLLGSAWSRSFSSRPFLIGLSKSLFSCSSKALVSAVSALSLSWDVGVSRRVEDAPQEESPGARPSGPEKKKRDSVSSNTAASRRRRFPAELVRPPSQRRVRRPRTGCDSTERKGDSHLRRDFHPSQEEEAELASGCLDTGEWTVVSRKRRGRERNFNFFLPFAERLQPDQGQSDPPSVCSVPQSGPSNPILTLKISETEQKEERSIRRQYRTWVDAVQGREPLNVGNSDSHLRSDKGHRGQTDFLLQTEEEAQAQGDWEVESSSSEDEIQKGSLKGSPSAPDATVDNPCLHSPSFSKESQEVPAIELEEQHASESSASFEALDGEGDVEERQEKNEAFLTNEALLAFSWSRVHVWIARPQGGDKLPALRCNVELPLANWNFAKEASAYHRDLLSVNGASLRLARLKYRTATPGRTLPREAEMLQTLTLSAASSPQKRKCASVLPSLRRCVLTEALNPSIVAALRQAQEMVFHLLAALEPWTEQTQLPPVLQVYVHLEKLAAEPPERSNLCFKKCFSHSGRWPFLWEETGDGLRQKLAQELMTRTLWTKLLARLQVQVLASQSRCDERPCCRCRKRCSLQGLSSVRTDEERRAFCTRDSADETSDQSSTASSASDESATEIHLRKETAETIDAASCCSGWRSIGRVSAETPDGASNATYLLQRCPLCPLPPCLARSEHMRG